MSYYRQLSPLEVTYLGTDTETHSPLVNQFIVEGMADENGQFDLDAWQRANQQVADANPGIRLKLKGLWGFKYWDDAGPIPVVRQLNSEWDGKSSRGADMLGTPINPRTDAVAQILLIPGNPALVIFRTHHGVTDGKGTLFWMEEIFRALRGEPLKGSEGRYVEWDIVSELDVPPREVREGNCIPVTPPAVDASLKGVNWLRMDIETSATRIMPRVLVVLAKLARQHNTEAGKVLFRVPSDLRRLRKNDAFSMANVTASIDIEITPEHTAKDIQKMLVRALRNNGDTSVFPSNTYLARWLPMKLFRFRPEVYTQAHERGTYRMTGVVSYPGDIALAQYSGHNFSATHIYAVPIPFEDRGISFALFSHDNGITLLFNIPKALADWEQMTNIATEIETLLKET